MALVNPQLAEQQIKKRLFANQTNGWLGVVVFDALGQPVGQSVDPQGTVWLSEAEVILTSRAPAKAKDNPFEEQVFIGMDANGQRQEFKMRPLIPVETDERYSAQAERYIPPAPDPLVSASLEAHTDASAKSDSVASTAAQVAASEAVTKDLADIFQSAAPPVVAEVPPTPVASGPEAGVTAALPAQLPAVAQPPTTGSDALQGAPGASESAEQAKSWTEPPPAPGVALPQPGGLQGANGPLGGQDTTPAPVAPAPVQQPPIVQQPPTAPPMSAEELAGGLPSQPAAEEHASTVDPQVGEETGAALPPIGEPVQGEYAQAEEVGSPDAPTINNPTPAES